MKNVIANYLPLSSEEKILLWENAIFFFDTNVLLNLYRYKSTTSKSLLQSLEALKGRIWMPSHVAYEFGRDRYNVIYEILDKYKGFGTKIDKFKNELADDLRIQKDEKEIIELEKCLKDWVNKYQSVNLSVMDPSDDKILTKLLILYNDKVGDPYSEADLKKIMDDGKERFAKGIPPGYKDSNKVKDSKDNNAYGDYIIWKQIMDYSVANKKDIVFITSDKKEDWWKSTRGREIGPREELRIEFGKLTQQKFHMYTSDRYLEIYLSRKKSGEDQLRNQKIVAEVKRVNRDEDAKTITRKYAYEIDEAMANYIIKAVSSLPIDVWEQYRDRQSNQNKLYHFRHHNVDQNMKLQKILSVLDTKDLQNILSEYVSMKELKAFDETEINNNVVDDSMEQ